MANKPFLPDKQTLQAMGYINSTLDSLYTNNIARLRIMDEQVAVNKIIIHNLPLELSNNLVWRIIYYKGQGCLFYQKETDKFYFLPYCLNSDGKTALDIYGRYTGVTPITFTGSVQDSTDSKKEKDKIWIPGLIKHPQYDICLDPDEDKINNSCVILRGYSQQMSQTTIPMCQMTEPLIQTEAAMIPFLRTALANSTGVTALRVGAEDENAQVDLASASVQWAALTGRKWIGITSTMEFQDLQGSSPSQASEFLLAMQAIDNYRLGTHGLKNGGLFQKQAHVLQAEEDMNGGMSDLILHDCLDRAIEFCDIANSIWGLGLYAEINPATMGILTPSLDMNYDSNESESEEKDDEPVQ